MYILKNALRSISRAKGRNFLMGLIVFIIALSACISLSIREASDTAKEEALKDLKVTAQISPDREAMTQNLENMEDKKSALEGASGLTLEELETYAEAESVSGFYYTVSSSLNGESLEPVDTTGISQDDSNSQETAEGESVDGMPGAGNTEMGQGGREMGQGRMGTQGDFTVTGYSSDAAMTDFIEGSSSITDGAMFAEGTADSTCVINSELASYNSLSVGDTITLSNPNAEDETYELTICGIYEKESAGDSTMNMMGGFSTAADSANQIYVSYQTLEEILNQSESVAETTTDSTTGQTTTTAMQSMLNGTYEFNSVEDYEKFEGEAEELGLPENYTITSSDLTTYEQSLEPLQNLSKYAGYFLLVILVIGAAILVVLHIFSIRERKYEIGVLAAIGMKKWKIAVQFLTESLCVTFCALIIGAGIGAVSSVPITNQLLEQQIESTSSSFAGQTERFGREMGMQQGGNDTQGMSSESNVSGKGAEQEPGQGGPGGFQAAVSYVDSISSATNLMVIVEMIGIGLLLTLVSGCTALIFILRYDPLRILSNRD